MVSPANGSYQVAYSGAVGDALRELQREAAQRGQGNAFVAAFRWIVRALRKDPHAVGEPLYHLPNLRLQVRTIVRSPLVIDFAVGEDRPIVYIKSGRLLSAQDS
jgi:hypothetical protein